MEASQLVRSAFPAGIESIVHEYTFDILTQGDDYMSAMLTGLPLAIGRAVHQASSISRDIACIVGEYADMTIFEYVKDIIMSNSPRISPNGLRYLPEISFKWTSTRPTDQDITQSSIDLSLTITNDGRLRLLADGWVKKSTYISEDMIIALVREATQLPRAMCDMFGRQSRCLRDFRRHLVGLIAKQTILLSSSQAQPCPVTSKSTLSRVHTPVADALARLCKHLLNGLEN